MGAPGEEALNRLMVGIFGGLGHAMEQLGYVLLSISIAAPAIAWMLILLAEWALPMLKRSRIASGIAGFVLTVLVVVAIGSVINRLHPEFEASFPAFCILLYAPATLLHVRARHSFNQPRAVGLIAAQMPVIVFWVGVALGY